MFLEGIVFVLMSDCYKEVVVLVVKDLVDLGLKVVVIEGIWKILCLYDLEVGLMLKLYEGWFNVLDGIKNGEI